jgi:tRNA-specific 2-thiouridylase
MTDTVLLAMSGGVDSSVSAIILKNMGYLVSGATMKLFRDEDIFPPPQKRREKSCCSLTDINDAREVATRLDLDYKVFNFRLIFQKEVIKPFALSYLKGKTPNPCLDCNRKLKFVHFRERAAILGHRFMATGHYARIEKGPNGRFLLKKAKDPQKDQSYVLYNMTQEQLAEVIFPLGHLSKEEVRQLALENGLLNAQKPDSQDICFVPDGHYSDFISHYLSFTPPQGNILFQDGRILGQHLGIQNYTVGQRKGLKIPWKCPLYVTDINPKTNTITVGEESDLLCQKTLLEDVNFIAISDLTKPMEIKVKIRYRQTEVEAEISPYDQNHILLNFKSPQKGVSPGQAAVFYQGDLVVGGGIISRNNF